MVDEGLSDSDEAPLKAQLCKAQPATEIYGMSKSVCHLTVASDIFCDKRVNTEEV